MADTLPHIGASDAYRKLSLLERIGTRVARIPTGAPLRRLARAVYRLTLRIVSGSGGLTATLPGGESIKISPAFRYLTWNPAEYSAFRAAVAPGCTALDIGANAGAYSLLLGRWVGSSGHVYALEPSSETYRGLVEHIQLNGLQKIVTPLCLAAGGDTGERVFSIDGSSGENRLTSGLGVTVQCVTIDDFCEANGLKPDFIKIDVEGSELEVLRGARKTLRECRDCIAVFVEMHPSIWRSTGVSPGDVMAELESQGFRAVPIRSEDDAWSIEGECLRLVPIE